MVVAPREARKVAMKALCRNVEFWNWLVGSRLGTAGTREERKSISNTYSIVLIQ